MKKTLVTAVLAGLLMGTFTAFAEPARPFKTNRTQIDTTGVNLARENGILDHANRMAGGNIRMAQMGPQTTGGFQNADAIVPGPIVTTELDTPENETRKELQDMKQTPVESQISPGDSTLPQIEEPQNGIFNPGGVDSCRLEVFQGLIGKPLPSEEELKILGFQPMDRIIPPESAITMDFRSDRLNIKTDSSNIVIEIGCY